MNLIRMSRAPYHFLLAAPLVFALIISFHAGPVYAVGLGATCSPLSACDTPYVCNAGKCAIDPSASPTVQTVNQGGGVDASNNSGTSGGLQNPLKVTSLEGLLDAIITGVVDIGSIFLVLMLVYVGFLFVAAQGNQEKIQSARSALVWTLIGGLILLGATAIKAVILATTATLL